MEFPRKSSWFTLISGKRFYPFDPNPADIRIQDIALSLSNLGRWNGHSRCFMSVAQHSVLVSEIVEPEFAFAGLMHDATEAYVGDLIRPIKQYTPVFREAEALVWAAVAKVFNLPEVLPHEVHVADNRILMTEARDLLMPFCEEKYFPGVTEKPIDKIICDPSLGIFPMKPMEAQESFLERFIELGTSAKG